MEVYDVGLLEGPCGGDVDACIGDVGLPEARAVESAMGQDGEAFPQLRPLAAHLDDCRVVGLFVTYHEPRLHAVFVEGHHETSCGYCSAAARLACADEQNLHR